MENLDLKESIILTVLLLLLSEFIVLAFNLSSYFFGYGFLNYNIFWQVPLVVLCAITITLLLMPIMVWLWNNN